MKSVTVWKALSDETRRAILKLLLSRSYCVRALARRLDLSEAAISQHLKILRDAELVIGEKNGYFMHYIVNRQLLKDTAKELESWAAIPYDTCCPEHGACMMAVMTGESLPVDKTVGDEVSSGTVNQFGAFEMEATKVGEDSSIQRMIRLVQSADAEKAKIVGLADRWATWIVVIALSAAALAWLFTGEIIRAVTILVVFCPCALVLATPTAIMAAIGNATKHGFLVREGDALERLASVSKITFDKTGTLTYGTPQGYGRRVHF